MVVQHRVAGASPPKTLDTLTQAPDRVTSRLPRLSPGTC